MPGIAINAKTEYIYILRFLLQSICATTLLLPAQCVYIVIQHANMYIPTPNLRFAFREQTE